MIKDDKTITTIKDYMNYTVKDDMNTPINNLQSLIKLNRSANHIMNEAK